MALFLLSLVCGLGYIILEVSLSYLQRKIKISKRIENGKELYTA